MILSLQNSIKSDNKLKDGQYLLMISNYLKFTIIYYLKILAIYSAKYGTLIKICFNFFSQYCSIPSQLLIISRLFDSGVKD